MASEEQTFDGKSIIKTIIDKYMYLGIQVIILRGSWVYGTNDDFSDKDILVIVTEEVVKNVEEEKDQDMNEQDDIVKYEIGDLDIAIVSDKNYKKHLKHNCVRALEALSVPDKFVLFGNLDDYKKDLVIHMPALRKSFGKLCDNAWNRGCKKIIFEQDSEKEQRVGKKSLYHALRYLICAIHFVKHNKILWDDAQIFMTKQFYLDIKDKSAKELIDDELNSNGKQIIKKEYAKLYKSLYKTFKNIVLNEEQLEKAKK